jgi:hypothetical protein
MYKVHVGKYLFENLSIQNGLKKFEVLWPLLFNFGLEIAIADRSFENVKQFRYLRTRVKKNPWHESANKLY